jgi:hypothetical protein
MPDDELLSVSRAAEYANVPKTLLENGEEVSQQVRGRRRYYSKVALDEWIETRKRRTIDLGKEDYAKCFDFALAMYYRGYTAVDWGTSRKREAGQSITNWVRGQLGEIAVQKFLQRDFRKEVELDFDLHDEIVPQDIIGVRERGVMKQPRIKIGIKATKFKNSFLILSAADVEPENRKSDAYILTRINLPDDHLLRISKPELEKLLVNERHFSTYKNKLSNFEPVPCEVVGFVYIRELNREDDPARLAKILGTRSVSGYRYIMAAGKMHNSTEDWQVLANSL